MKRLYLALLTLAAAFAVAPAASASSFAFTFTLSGGDLLASGDLLGDQTGNTGVYDITAASIGIWTRGKEYISGPVTVAGVDGSDDLLTPGASGLASYVSFGGLSFLVYGYFVNIYAVDQTLGEGFLGDGTDTYGVQADPLGMGYFKDLPGELAIVATPEPSSLVLLGAGFFVLALIAFRKVKSSARFGFHR